MVSKSIHSSGKSTPLDQVLYTLSKVGRILDLLNFVLVILNVLRISQYLVGSGNDLAVPERKGSMSETWKELWMRHLVGRVSLTMGEITLEIRKGPSIFLSYFRAGRFVLMLRALGITNCPTS
jgi:hypothetical protein